MPAKAPVPIIDVKPSTATVSKVREEGLALLPPLQSSVQGLAVVDAESYLVADTMLGKIQTARKSWTARMERIIRPIRSGLDELYAFNREVDKPLGQLEDAVKAKMKAFKTEELRQLRAAEEARAAEVERLRREAEAKAERESSARTAQMREKLAKARSVLEAQATEIEQEERPEPVQGASSGVRVPKKMRVIDVKEFCAGVADGTIPVVCVTAHVAEINRQYRMQPATVSVWPGCEEYEDLQIVGR